VSSIRNQLYSLYNQRGVNVDLFRWKDGEVNKDKADVPKDKVDAPKDKVEVVRDKETTPTAEPVRPKRPERTHPLGKALTAASMAPPVSPR
jgi:hypothetical protein